MAHFNFVISQNAKWRHAGFYIDCHRMTVPENILLQKSTGYYAVRIVCRKRHKTVECTFVHPSVCWYVCPIYRQRQRRPVGFAAEARFIINLMNEAHREFAAIVD